MLSSEMVSSIHMHCFCYCSPCTAISSHAKDISHIYIYIYIYIHTHTYLHTYIQTYIHTHTHTCMHTYKHMHTQYKYISASSCFWRMVSSGMLRLVALVRTDVSEKLSASFIRVTRNGELGTTLAVTSNRWTQQRNTNTNLVFLHSGRRLLVTASVVTSSPFLVTLFKEALSFSETSDLTRATWRNIPEDAILHSHRRENLKSYIIMFLFPYDHSDVFITFSFAVLSWSDELHASTVDLFFWMTLMWQMNHMDYEKMVCHMYLCISVPDLWTVFKLVSWIQLNHP
jgi:hypothetical protein